MRKQQDNNFKIKLFTDTDVLVNNYEIIIDKTIYLCYNIYIIREMTKALDKKIKKIKEKMSWKQN